jgi:probable addiction module antidote protein
MKTSKYDIVDYLDSNEIVAEYLDLAFESGDISRIWAALGNVARAKGDDQDCASNRSITRATLQNA